MIFEIIVLILASFTVAYAVLPSLIKNLTANGYLGADMHKANRPKIPQPGGLVLFFSFTFSVLAYMAFVTYSNGEVSLDLFAGLLSVIIAGFIGLADDFLRMKWRNKLLLAFLPALPLMVLKAGVSEMYIPLIGSVDFGVFYSLVLIPLMFNFAVNEFNMVAGYNGIETGLAIISMVTILVASIVTGKLTAAILVACMLGGAFALFLFNKYPAKVFIGDTGTFILGSTLITVLIIANMEKLALGIFFIYFLDFVGFAFCLKNGCRTKFARIDSAENLHPNCGHRTYFFLPYYFPNLKLKERDITKIFLGAQAVICALSLVLFL